MQTVATSVAGRYVGAVMAIALVVSTSGHDGTATTVKPGRVGTYQFDVYPEGDVLHLLSATFDGRSDAPRMRYQRSIDGGATWSRPTPVDEGATPPFIEGRGVDPQIAASGDRLVAVWTTAGDDVYGYGTGPLATVVSDDGGRTWRPGPNPADDGSTVAHEYIDIAADAAGAFHVLWMDDRDHKSGVRRGLRYANSLDGAKSWSRNLTLDQTICGCCWTYLRSDGKDLYVFYRDTDPAPSDYVLLRSGDRGRTWDRLGVVGSFGWMFKGCPHQTAGLAIAGSTIHAVVMTGKEDVAGIYYLSSRNGGREWGAPVPIAPDGRHADLAANADGTQLAVVWQSMDARGGIVAITSRDGGAHWSEPVHLTGPLGSQAGFPRVVAWRGAFRVLWTDVAADGSFTFSSSVLPGDSAPRISKGSGPR